MNGIQELSQCSQKDLRKMYQQGAPIAATQLPSGIYEGTSLGLPSWLIHITWRKFFKVIELDVRGYRVGYNAKAQQNDLNERWIFKNDNPVNQRYGFFELTQDKHPSQLMGSHPRDTATIDYSTSPRNKGILRRIKDPLVYLDGPRPIILGRSYVVLGRNWLPTPSYFSLVKHVS